ncbi:MAG: hypothetical protein ACLQUY_02105 [Ktedonobacterales bacterium]
MVTIVSADISSLLESIVSGEEDTMIGETLALLGPQKVPPTKLAAHVGIPAAWGGGDGYALSTLSVAGRVAEWMRWVPIGPEPGADERRALAPALPLTQGFVAVAGRVGQGLVEPHPAMPEPLMPRDVKNADGPLGALRESLVSQDVDTVRRILRGYYATGTDYRNVLTAIYATLALSYPEVGRPLSFAVSGSRVLDMADWGDKMPAFIYWFAPLMVEVTPGTPVEDAARQYAMAPGHDLGWLRTRLSIPTEEAAGLAYQNSLVAGSAEEACEATLKALKQGATPMGVAAGISLAAAELVNGVPAGDSDGLYRAAQVLLYTHSVHVATTQTQDPRIWPLLYTAASAVNAAQSAARSTAALKGSRAAPSTPVGGLIAASMLRTLEQLLLSGDSASAVAVAHRYLQMGHSSRALAGIIGSAAASHDVRGAKPNTFHPLVLAAAAVEEYLTTPTALAAGGKNGLLTAAIRLAGELDTGHQLAQKVRRAIDQEISESRAEKSPAK